MQAESPATLFTHSYRERKCCFWLLLHEGETRCGGGGRQGAGTEGGLVGQNQLLCAVRRGRCGSAAASGRADLHTEASCPKLLTIIGHNCMMHERRGNCRRALKLDGRPGDRGAAQRQVKRSRARARVRPRRRGGTLSASPGGRQLKMKGK